MKKILLLALILAVASTVRAQQLKITDVSASAAPAGVEFPTDLNGNKCALVEIALQSDNVVFEGNVVGTPAHQGGVYRIYLTPNSRNLNIKYPGGEPILMKFSDYGVTKLPSGSLLTIVAEEPSGNLVEELDNGMEEVSDEAEQLYEKGAGLMMANDYVNAYTYFLQAYEKGHPKAAYQLGFIYSDPYHTLRKMKGLGVGGVTIPDSPVKRDMTKAYEYYREGAEAGYVLAQFAVGECLEKGNGVKKNKDEARIWYEKAAAQGHLQAQDKIGGNVKKERTLGIVTSYGSSDNEFIPSSLSCDASDLSAVTGGRKDKNGQYCALVKVMLPFEGVTFGGDTIGMAEFRTNEYWVYFPQGTKGMEIYYKDFKPLKFNFKTLDVASLVGKNSYVLRLSFPIDLLQEGVELSAEEYYNIGIGYMERRDNQHVRWMSKAAELDHPQALFQLGTCYLYGNGVKKDKVKGVAMLEKAANLGLGESAHQLGFYYEMIERSKKKAQPWYDKAAELGYNGGKAQKAKNRKMGSLFGVF